jgi:hypothetical protein
MNGTTYADTIWNLITPTAGIIVDTSSQTWSTSGIVVANSAPTSPKTGSLWVDTSTQLIAGTGPAAWTALTAWSSSTTYTAGPPASVVTRNGGTYVAVATSLNVDPATDNGSNWETVAAAGATGASGGTIALDATLTLGPQLGTPVSTGTSADGGHVHSANIIGSPKDYGLLGMSIPVESAVTTGSPTAGVAATATIRVPTSGTMSNVWLYISNAPVITNYAYISVYYGGTYGTTTLLGTSANQKNTWTSAGLYETNIGTNLSYTGSILTVAWWIDAGTSPSYLKAGLYLGLANASGLGFARFGSTGTGLTNTPPSAGFTPSLTGSNGAGYWVGVS